MAIQKYAFETGLSINVKRLEISQYPRISIIDFECDGQLLKLELVDPLPIGMMCAALGTWQIKIIDKNREGNCLEFGRYLVQFWDEDNPIAEVTVDSYRFFD
jgi:hypothetical protein